MTPVDPAVIRRKLGLIINNLQALESIRDIPPVRYREDLFLRKGTERLLQETIEAAIDLNTHLLVQSGPAPPDDYLRCFLLLAERGILPAELAAALAPSAGLRNRLVHEAHGAMNKEHHVCARRRVGEPAVFESPHACRRPRDGETLR